MSEEVKLNLKPIAVNPIADSCSDTVYIFGVRDALGDEVDLRGYTARMQLRPYPGAKRAYDELTTENGRLDVRGSNVTVKFPADITKDYRFEKAVYDLVIISMAGTRYRIAEGVVQFREGVTW